jgi:hypothetical protein
LTAFSTHNWCLTCIGRNETKPFVQRGPVVKSSDPRTPEGDYILEAPGIDWEKDLERDFCNLSTGKWIWCIGLDANKNRAGVGSAPQRKTGTRTPGGCLVSPPHPRSTSREIYQGVLDGHGRAVFNGRASGDGRRPHRDRRNYAGSPGLSSEVF